MLKLIALCLGLILMNPAYAKAVHPLDPLDAGEVKSTLEILKTNHLLGEKIMIPYLMLKEPKKAEVIAFAPGSPFTRQAEAILYDRESGRTWEVIVDLRGKKITSNTERPNAHPAVMLSEFDAVPPIVKADPRFKAAMERRGIKNLDDVAIDTWGYGSPDSEHSENARLLRALAYFKGKGKNFYAKPIEGFTAVVNMNTKQIEQVVDSEMFPIPPVSSDLDEKSLGKQRPRLKPLKISQPEGPEFTQNGFEVKWQNWSFHFAMHPREGLVLYLVKYNDHGRWRSIIYRANLDDMMVPYGHPDKDWTWRAAFDEGEYGIGRYSASLEKGTDVPENAKLLDALFVDDFGKPYTTKNAVALYERDGGMLWKHVDMYNGGNFARRARELVIGSVSTISNYDYGMNWVFRQDGTISFEVGLTGIMLAKGTQIEKMGEHMHDMSQSDAGSGARSSTDSSAAADMRFGHLVAPYVLAPHHQHFFNVRLDMDIDGAGGNDVAELNTVAIPFGKENPSGNAFEMTQTQLHSEKEAERDMDYKSQRKWIVYNPSSRNSLGYPAGYILLPGENAEPYLQPESPLLKRGGFVKHALWATQQNDDEMYAAGRYPNQRSTSDGLPVWTEKNRSLDNQDVVLWYTFCVTHAPRPEEWPVMTVHKTGFQLIPAGFFDRNPSLDVPK
jgi:primary-amine oxidase